MVNGIGAMIAMQAVLQRTMESRIYKDASETMMADEVCKECGGDWDGPHKAGCLRCPCKSCVEWKAGNNLLQTVGKFQPNYWGYLPRVIH